VRTVPLDVQQRLVWKLMTPIFGWVDEFQDEAPQLDRMRKLASRSPLSSFNVPLRPYTDQRVPVLRQVTRLAPG
jgi:hypothetical protein